MNCRSAESLFSSFLEDELSQKERRSFETHLLSCRRCSVAIRELRATIDMVQTLPDVETSPHFEEDVLALIRSGEAMRPSVADWVRGLLEPARLRPVFLAGAGACAVWIAVILAGPSGVLHGASMATTSVKASPSGAAAPSAPGLASTTTRAGAPAQLATPTGAGAGNTVASVTPAVSASGLHTSRPVARSADNAWADRQWTATAGNQDSTVPNPGAHYVDEYITDQFYIDRGFEGQSPSVTPVSDHPSDDVEIQF
jgi:anti-sigma factor RsiW